MKIRQSKVKIIFLIIFLLISFNSLTNLQNSYPTENLDGSILGKVQDEFHTLVLGTKELLGERNDVNRIGSFTRFSIKALSPFGVFYMNNKMGGEHHITTENMHNFAGYSYLERNLNGFPDIIHDPNVQNFRFAILLLRNLIFILLLTFISYILYNQNYILSSIAVLISTVFNRSFILSEKLLYTDFSNLLILYIFLFCFINKNLNQRTKNYIYLLLTASIISNGLSNVIFVPIILSGFNKYLKKDFLKYISFFILIFFTLNIAELRDPINYLDNQLWNFYHYWTGHYIIEPTGVEMLRKIAFFSFPWFGAFVLMPFYKFVQLNNRRLFLILCMTQIIILVSGSQLRVFEPRNYLGLTTIGIFIGILFLMDLEKKFVVLKPRSKNNLSILIIILFLLPLVRSVDEESLLQSELNRVDCEKLLIINETSLNFPNEKVDNLSIVITSPVEAPTYFNELEQTINPYDCLIIKDTNESKNISTFVAPNSYNIAKRTKNYFLFYK